MLMSPDLDPICYPSLFALRNIRFEAKQAPNLHCFYHPHPSSPRPRSRWYIHTNTLLQPGRSHNPNVL
ncbi:hypothetical protein VTJ04DRAFT_3111 [Mycothermus thermophilus]|uniref:uncharacterized protein n=1 Tax=Humicola insolens TaxID=85995 RepID=UPI00374235D5